MEERLTPHRLVVLEIVRTGPGHPTAREVFERSSSRSPRLSFATVYNALKYLVGKKLLVPVRLDDDAVRYDPMMERHDHLLCRKCGCIMDVPSSPDYAVAAPREGAAAGFHIEDMIVHFRGLCAECGEPAGKQQAAPKNKRKPR